MTDLRCLCIEVRSAAQTLTRLYDQALIPAGITVTQLSQLNAIYQLSEPTVSQLSKAIGLDRSTLGRNIRLLESMQLLTSQIGQDARTRTLRLTKKGMAALKGAAPLWASVQSRLTQKLGTEKRELLLELMADLASTDLREINP